MEKLFIFNGAGTLLDSEVSGFRWLARKLGKEQEEREHLVEYEKVKREGPWGLPELAELFEGVDKNKLEEEANKFVKANLILGAKELIAGLKGEGYFIAFYSSDPMEICEAVKLQLGIDEVYGNRLEYREGKASGKLAEKVDRYDRANRIKELVTKNNLGREEVYILGNSITALPSKEHGKLIAFNYKDKEVAEQADEIVEEKDLKRVLEVVR